MEFSNRRNFFSLSNSLDECFLAYGMNIFLGQLACMNFFHLIFPCANILVRPYTNKNEKIWPFFHCE